MEALETREDLLITDLPIYDTVYEQSELVDEAKAFDKNKMFCAVFTSASTVRGFVEAVPGLDYTKVTAACIGRQTKEAADAYGMQTYMAEIATIDALVDLVVRLKTEGRDRV